MNRIFILVIILSSLLVACGGETSSSAPGLTPRFAYVVNGGSDTVSRYMINSSTGELTTDENNSLNGPFATGSKPVAIALSPDNKFALVTNYGSTVDNGSISIFSIDPGTGDLTSTGANIPMESGTYPYGIAINRDGFVFVANHGLNSLSVYKLTNTGTLDPVTGSPFEVGAGPFYLALNPVRNSVYVTSYYDDTVHAFDVDSTTGVLTAISGSPFATGNGPNGVAASQDGMRIYLTNQIANTISVFDVDVDGVLVEPDYSGFGTGGDIPDSIAISPNSQFIYATNWADDNITGFKYTASTGYTTNPLVNTGDQPLAITIDPSGRFLYVPNVGDDTISAFSINQVTGELTAISEPVQAAAGSKPVAIAIFAN